MADRDPETGRFLTGNTGGGRPKGSRNKLGEQFILDMQTVWEETGIDALRRVAAEDPGKFCTIAAGILPRDVAVEVKHTIGREPVPLDQWAEEFDADMDASTGAAARFN